MRIPAACEARRSFLCQSALALSFEPPSVAAATPNDWGSGTAMSDDLLGSAEMTELIFL